MTAINRRLAAFVAASALAGAGVGAVAGAATPASGDDAVRAKALTSAPATDWADTTYPVAQARPSWPSVPPAPRCRPAARSSGVRWELGEGVIAESEIDGVIAYNAACQWLRAWRDGRDAATAARSAAQRAGLARLPGHGLRRVPRPRGRARRRRAAAARRSPAMLRDCDAAHPAKSPTPSAIGLPPST